MAEYGMIYDTDSIKKQLLDSNRDYNNQLTWKNMFMNTNLYSNKAQQNLRSDFTSVSNQAYSSYLQNQNAIQNSNVVGSSKKNLLNQNQDALMEAYTTYMNNVSQGMSDIEKSRQSSLNTIDDALTEQAVNVKDYANAHFDYLEKLYEQYEMGENDIFMDKQWSKYLTTDEDGNERLLTKQELMSPKYEEFTDDKGKVNKEWLSLYDDEGNLTMRGLDFFDQVQNQNITENSFGQYLSEANEDLYNWSREYNSYNYTFDGTNTGSFKTMVGLASDDYEYSFLERFGGLTSNEITSMYKDFEHDFDNLKDSFYKNNAKSINKDLKGISGNLENFAKELGIDDVFNFKGLNELFDEAEKQVKSGGQLTGDWFSTMTSDWMLLTTTGAAAGSTSGPAGTVVGSLIGAVVGFFTGIIDASIKVGQSRKDNATFTKQTIEAYNNLLNEMVNYSLYNKRQSEIEFNRNK